MRNFKIILAMAIAVLMLATTASTALAAGPADDQTPDTFELRNFVHSTVQDAISTSQQVREGPAPCLNEGDQFLNIPYQVGPPGNLK